MNVAGRLAKIEGRRNSNARTRFFRAFAVRILRECGEDIRDGVAVEEETRAMEAKYPDWVTCMAQVIMYHDQIEAEAPSSDPTPTDEPTTNSPL
jgi:hypothetical protein